MMPRCVLRTALLLCCCCWMMAPASSAQSDGQEPWLVVWKKGVDGAMLWNTLCPTVSTGDDSPSFWGAATGSLDATGGDGGRRLKSRGQQELVLNCSARFSHLFNGFAGHLTLKQLDSIKAQYKNNIDFVISDKAIQVDSPPALLHAQQQDQLASDAEHAQATVPSTGPAGSKSEAAVLTLDIADGPHAHRQLLLTAPYLRSPAAVHRMLPEQHNATWGLDMIDQGHLPLDTIYDYTYNGTGVHVYILDTGIRSTHTEFFNPDTNSARAVHGFDAVYSTNSSDDCHGHGTHVAAVVGGNTFGVAKNVTLHAVRVLACDGTAMVSALLKGLEWVAKHHIKPAVVHMSIEGGFSSVVNQAVEQLIKIHHVHVVVSSGNSGKDACLASPASAPSAITVAAIDDKLARWSYANWGACVDVFAPGVAILSAVSNKGDTGTALKTGTSMAAPFVTGVVAAYLEAHPGASAEEVQQKLYQTALRGSVVDDPQGFATLYPNMYPDLLDISSTPNRLLHANLSGQAVLQAGNLYVNETPADPLSFTMTLSEQPSDNVTATLTVPNAWDGSPLAAVEPSQLTFTTDTWNQPQAVSLKPRALCDGDYYIKLSMQGAGVDGYPAMHTVLVHDSRHRSGDDVAMARVIKGLPFNDSGDTTAFHDNYGCQATDASPDVVYSYTPSLDVDVAITTCGSGFDTKLLVSTNLSDPSTYMCNDDDRGCTINTACSRLDVSLTAGTTYYIVVDGYSGASGEYSLSVTCNPRCPVPGQPQDASSEGSSNAASPGGAAASSPHSSSSTMLIQALLHLSHPAGDDTAATSGSGRPGRGPTSPESPSPANPSPASGADVNPTPFNPGTTVRGPVVTPFWARPATSPSPGSGPSPAPPKLDSRPNGSTRQHSSPPTQVEVEGRSTIQGPIAALLAVNNGDSGGTAEQPHVPPSDSSAGPLSLIRSSGFDSADRQLTHIVTAGPRSTAPVQQDAPQASAGDQNSSVWQAGMHNNNSAIRHDAGPAGDALAPGNASNTTGSEHIHLGHGGVDASLGPHSGTPQGQLRDEQKSIQGDMAGEAISLGHAEAASVGDSGAPQPDTTRHSGRWLETTAVHGLAVNELQHNQPTETRDSSLSLVNDDMGWEEACAELASLTLTSEQQLPLVLNPSDEH